MEVNVENGGILVREFSVSIKKGTANKHWPLTTRLWWIKIQGNIFQEGLGFVILIALSLITITLELIGNLLVLLGYVLFYFIKGIIDLFFWIMKLALKTIFGSVGKGLSILFIAFAILIIYYLYDTKLWLKLFDSLDWLSSFL